ncbi:MAG: zinc ribbon domain-containing protein [Chloroflexi bacterium]|nr:zinc ribbon domain-containing protein [Chloroflexota bacterium]
MKKLPAVIAVLLSIPLYTFGVLFLIAASAKSSRIWVGLVLAAIATFLLVVGLRRLRRLAEIAPDALRTGAIDLAQRLGGEVTVAQLRAEYRISQDLATKTLEQLVSEGSCQREEREERTVYVVTGLKPAMVEKVCPYCGTKLPVRSDLRKCPNCGANLEMQKT